MIFKQFRHMKNLPLPGSGYFKNYPPVYVTGPKCDPLPPPPSPQDATCLRLRNCVQHVFWPVADKPKSIARSFVIVQYGSEFAAPVLTWAQKRSDLREKSTVGKFVRSSLQGLNHEDVLLKLETKIINNAIIKYQIACKRT